MTNEPHILTPERTSLWLTSRSTFERGTQFCPWARFVENHAGPYGYGIQRRAMSVPLVTGTYSHLGITEILKWILDARQHSGVQPTHAPDDLIRWAVQEAITKYRQVVEKRGILTMTEDDPDTAARLKRLITEQEFLIAGLTWAYALRRLPHYLREYLIVEVEGEQETVLDCTCGIGSGVGFINDHEARGCTGIGLLSKPDILGSRHVDQVYGYTELKTAGVARKAWNDSWERKQQFLMGIVGAENRYGVEITHAYVEGLIKGQRKRNYPFTEDLPKLQQTSLCYAYYCPPTTTSEAKWRPGFNYYDLEGIKHTAGKKEGYRHAALWEPPEGEAWPGKPEEMTITEYWAKTMAAEFPTHLDKNLSVVGPIPKQRHQIDKALRSVVCEERTWQDRLWRLYDFSVTSGKTWGDDEYMEFAETIIPRSWNCDPYGPDHPCQHQVMCHPITDDWRKPVESELYVYRSPHHVAERQQMIARGLKPEDGLAEEIEEMEGDDD